LRNIALPRRDEGTTNAATSVPAAAGLWRFKEFRGLGGLGTGTKLTEARARRGRL
jgi:hypothetical protein